MRDYFDNKFNGKKQKIIFITHLLFMFFSVNASFAAQPPSVKADVSCQEFNYPWCGVQELGGSSGLINTIYNYSLAAVGIAALGAIIYGGIMYTVSAGNPSKQSDAVAWITGAIWGIVLLLGASLLLRTINPEIVKLQFPKIEPIEIAAPPAAIQVSMPQSLMAERYTNQDALVELDKYGIKVTSSTGCIGQDAKGCTDLEGMPKYVPIKLWQLKASSNADIVITGGTEATGHVSHGPGKAIVDLRFNSNLDNYIYSNAVSATNTDNGVVYKTADGSTFLKEDDHWHVFFSMTVQ